MNYINILADNCFSDATGAPIAAGVLTVTPSTKFRVGGGGQALGEPIQRIIKDGSLLEPLQLANPALTSPLGIGYSFEVMDSGTRVVETYNNVLIAADANGNWNLSNLDTGSFVTAIPATSSNTAPLTVTAPLTELNGTVSIPKATTTSDGYLSASDFTVFAANANPAAVAITGGTINGTSIGATAPAAGSFTSVSTTDVLNVGTGVAFGPVLQIHSGLQLINNFGAYIAWGQTDGTDPGRRNYFYALNIGGGAFVDAPDKGLSVGSSQQFRVDGSGNISILSPNGTRYRLNVANNGTLSTTAI